MITWYQDVAFVQKKFVNIILLSRTELLLDLLLVLVFFMIMFGTIVTGNVTKPNSV